jgi:NAD(P)-dependent dehydrogenase (short-subunit alcohol dehydrogenase family)
MRMKDEEWDAVIRVNLEAAFRLMRSATKPMMKARFGRIISVTSVVGATGNPGQVNYAAAKAGLVGMSKSLAQELASRNVTVNCVAPGFIRTAMTDVCPMRRRTRSTAASRWAAWAKARISARRWPIWPARKPVTSPARRCM